MWSTANTLLLNTLKHTTVRFSRAADDTASPSEQAAAGSSTEPTGKKGFTERQLSRRAGCARTDNPEGCAVRAHGSVNSQVFYADRQTANREGSGNSGSVAAATFITLGRDALFPSSSLLQGPSIHTTNTLTADTRLSWFLIMPKNSSLKMDAMSISH